MRSFKKFVEAKKIVEYIFVPALYKGKWAVLDTVSQVYYDVKGGKDAAEKKCKELNDIHHKAPVKLDPLEEAEYNKEWWDSKSDNFKKRYIERHPNSIYAQKANTSSRDDESPAMRAARDASNIMNRVKLAIGDKKNNVKKDSGLLGDRYDAKHGTKPEKSNAPLLGDREVKDVTQPSLDSVKRKYGKRYQNIEDFVSDYDVEQFSKAATEYAYDVADGPDDVENHFDDFDGEYNVHYDDLEAQFKKKFGFTPDKADIAAILDKVGGKVNLV